MAACAGPKPAPTKAPLLRVVAVPDTASVQVDERFVAAAKVLAMRPAPLRAGKHRVTIEAPGYFPHDLEVELQPGVTTVEITLRAVPR
ncbi:MAG: PEGA domain-containing protein [Polyangiales bacterium]